MKLLLASGSAARRQMLEAAGIAFETVKPELDEEAAKADLVNLSARQVAIALAEQKALSVGTEAALILGADQVLELDDGAMLSKSASRDDARRQLERLSGRTHELHSAAAIAEDGAIVWRGMESAVLSVRPLSPAFIDHYLHREYEEVRWSVGCYHIEGRGAQLFDRIEGSHFAILGLPLLPLLGYLRTRGILAS